MATREELLKVYPKEQIDLNPQFLSPDFQLPQVTPSVTPRTAGIPITGASLAPVPSVTLPEPKIDTFNFNALLDSGQAIIKSNQPTTFTTPSGAIVDSVTGKLISEPPKDSDSIKRLEAFLNPPRPSVEPLYQAALESSGIEAAQQEKIAKQANVRAAQAELAGIQAQVQGVISKRDAQNLQLEKQASGGQVTTTILNRQQQEINRQAAIEALPLQALALAKQAQVAGLQGEAEFAQSTLAIAQDKLNTAFKLKSEDAKNAYETLKENRRIFYDFWSDEQKRRAEAKQKQEDKEFQITNDLRNNQQALASKAIESNQGTLFTQIMALDPKSTTFNADIARLGAQIKPKEATGDIGEFENAKAKGLIPQTMGYFEYIRQKGVAGRKGDETGGISDYSVERAYRTIQSVNELDKKAADNPGIFGRSAAFPLPKFLRNAPFRNFVTELDTLKANIAFNELTAMREASKTGGALGQVSDREGQLLQSALGALDMTQSPKNFREQLQKINASVTRWQNAIKKYGTAVVPKAAPNNIITAPDGTQIEIID